MTLSYIYIFLRRLNLIEVEQINVKFYLLPNANIAFMSNKQEKSFFIFFLFFHFRAVPEAYGSSQARGQIRAAAASLPHSHSTRDLSCTRDLHHSLWATPAP